MSAIITHPTRKFRIGATLLPDPAPDATPEDAIKLYHATYPHIAFCTLENVGVEGDALIFEVRKPPAQTKGADPSGTLEALLDAWVDDSSLVERGFEGAAGQLAAFAERRLQQPSAAIDPWLIPLA
ncbi:MAG: hypothetical protein BGP25_15785 [Lysobacterales bacterium 63-13]|nr:MAG: hypothetical protein BGP25_15785 [Xanthomonadales bacterium 63-13]